MATAPETSDDERRKADTAAVFDRASATYERVGVDFFEPFGAALVDAAQLRPGERVLDLGCGTGAASVPAARMVRPGGSVLGIDLSQGMVDRCAARLAEVDGLDTAARVGDAESPDVPAGSVDVVLAALVLFFLPAPDRALRAANVALAPGGRLAASSFGPPDPRFERVFAAVASHLEQDPGTPARSAQEGPFASDASITELFESCGFDGVRHTLAERAVRFAGSRQWIDWSWSHGARQMWEAVPEERLGDATGAATAELERLAQPDGSIEHRFVLRCSLAKRSAQQDP